MTDSESSKVSKDAQQRDRMCQEDQRTQACICCGGIFFLTAFRFEFVSVCMQLSPRPWAPSLLSVATPLPRESRPNQNFNQIIFVKHRGIPSHIYKTLQTNIAE